MYFSFVGISRIRKFIVECSLICSWRSPLFGSVIFDIQYVRDSPTRLVVSCLPPFPVVLKQYV